MIENGENVLVWHSLFGYPQIINKDGMDLINLFSIPADIDCIKKTAGIDNVEESIRELKNCFFLIPINFDERRFLRKKISEHADSLLNGKQINYLSLIISEDCNFACTYCISSSMIEASRRHYNMVKRMSIETAKKAIDIFLSIQKSNGNIDANINFGGGEPLLGWKVIKNVLRYCKEKYGREFQFTFRINTNASLITKEIAIELKKFGVRVAMSLDGLDEGNDVVRVDKSGKSSFRRIIRAIDILSDVDFGVSGFSTTVTADNFYNIDERLIDFCQKRGFNDIRIDPDVIHMLSVPVAMVTEKIIRLKRIAEERGVHLTGFWERAAENLNSSILEKHIAFCGGVAGKSMCVSPSQEVFICGYSARKFSNLSRDEIVSSLVYQEIVRSRFAGELTRCRGCIIEGQCIGGCYITEEFDTSKKEGALNYNCELYKAMTIELLKDSLKEFCADSS